MRNAPNLIFLMGNQSYIHSVVIFINSRKNKKTYKMKMFRKINKSRKLHKYLIPIKKNNNSSPIESSLIPQWAFSRNKVHLYNHLLILSSLNY